MLESPVLSIVVPLYDEAENVRPLHSAIVSAVEPLGMQFEMIFVDDGSRDGTFETATGIARADPRVRVVKFRRNYGQTAAMTAGIEQATGRVVVTMDGDLQNDPRDIERFLEELDKGYDVVVGWRVNRQDHFLSRKLPSRVANWLIGKVTGLSIRDNGCSLKAFRASLIKDIPLYGEMHRFIPAMASIAGARIAEIKVRHHPRRFGQSKYGLTRIYKVLLDLLAIKTITSFVSRPLAGFTLLATPSLIAGLAALAFAAGQWTSAEDTFVSMPVMGAGILLIAASATLVCTGILGAISYHLGDIRDSQLSHLTSEVLTNPSP